MMKAERKEGARNEEIRLVVEYEGAFSEESHPAGRDTLPEFDTLIKNVTFHFSWLTSPAGQST